MKNLSIFLCLAIVSILPKANAQTPTDIAQIESYLNSIKTLEANFVQNASNGNVSEGKIWIQKPSKMRMEYNEPTNVLIVGNGDFVVYYDKDLDQVTNIDYSDIPATVILGNDIKIDNDNLKISYFYKDSGTTIATIEHKNNTVAPITLTFNNSPFELKQWKIVDPQSVEITVSLYGNKSDHELDNSLFRFKKNTSPLKRGR